MKMSFSRLERKTNVNALYAEKLYVDSSIFDMHRIRFCFSKNILRIDSAFSATRIQSFQMYATDRLHRILCSRQYLNFL